MAPISLSRILAHWADVDPDAPAVTHEGTTLSFAELEASSNRLARAYEALGVKEKKRALPDDRMRHGPDLGSAS